MKFTGRSKRSLIRLNNKMLTLLGFAAKAGKLSYGMDAAAGSLKAKKAYLAVAAGDVSQKSQKEIAFFAGKGNVQFLVLKGFNINAVSDAVGRRCGIITINDSGFADAFLKAYTEGGNAYDE